MALQTVRVQDATVYAEKNLVCLTSTLFAVYNFCSCDLALKCKRRISSLNSSSYILSVYKRGFVSCILWEIALNYRWNMCRCERLWERMNVDSMNAF